MIIRPERQGDRDQIRQVTAAAFGRALEAGLVDCLRGSGVYKPDLSLVAELDGQICGHGVAAAFMVRRLPGWNPSLRGKVVYPPCFDGLD